jgi:hypothetical protein
MQGWQHLRKLYSAISQKSAKSIREVMRSCRVHIHSDSSAAEVAITP